MHNLSLHRNNSNNTKSNNSHVLTLQKIKILYRSQILKHGKNYDFISDVQNYVLIKLCKMPGSIHLFKIIGTLKAKNMKLIKNYLWDTLEIDWKEVMVTFNGNKIDLPRVVIIKLQDKIKVR